MIPKTRSRTRTRFKPRPSADPTSYGVVVEVGPDTDGAPEPGTRVLASIGLGGFAEQVVAPIDAIVAIPDGLSDNQAATLVQSYATMRFAFTRRTTVRAGEWVAVLGASGGIGMAEEDHLLGQRVP